MTNKENEDKSKWLNCINVRNKLGSVIVEGCRKRQNVVLSDKKIINQLYKQAIISSVGYNLVKINHLCMLHAYTSEFYQVMLTFALGSYLATQVLETPSSLFISELSDVSVL